MKACSKCGVAKPIEEFSKHRGRRDGHDSRCKACNRANCEAWAAANPSAKKAFDKAYYRTNAEQIKARMALYHTANRDANLVRQRQQARWLWPEEKRKRAAWRDANRAVIAAHSEKRRASKLAGGGTVTPEEWAAILEYFDRRCAYCLEKTQRLTMDHVVALASGGRHEPQNVVPACRRCNQRKWRNPVFTMVSAHVVSHRRSRGIRRGLRMVS